MAMTCKSHGLTVFVENMFENRYRHVAELRRLGADVRCEGRVAVVCGVDSANESVRLLMTARKAAEHLLPLLRQENPRLAENTSAMALRLRQDEAYLAENQIKYQALVDLMNQEFSRYKTVLSQSS